METSVFLAKLLGPYFVIVGIGVLANLKYYQGMITDFMENKAMLYLGGVMALLFGLIIVLFHNYWALNWAVIITIMGWLGILKGIALIVCPGAMMKLSRAYIENMLPLATNLTVIIILGAVLCYMGYFA